MHKINHKRLLTLVMLVMFALSNVTPAFGADKVQIYQLVKTSDEPWTGATPIPYGHVVKKDTDGKLYLYRVKNADGKAWGRAGRIDPTAGMPKYYMWGETTLVGADEGTADIVVRYDNSKAVTERQTSYAESTAFVDIQTTASTPDQTLGGALKLDSGSKIPLSSIQVNADFMGNYLLSELDNVYGGAMYSTGTRITLTGDFLGNHAKSIGGDANGGAIYNAYGASIGGITGDLIGNFAESTNADAYGGAIYNYGQTIAIIGDFIGNYVLGKTVAQGGAIINHGQIGNITGDFMGNHAESTVGSVYGGAIYNNEFNKPYGEIVIRAITGDFIGNYAKSSYNAYGGAICSTESLGDITGNFIGNFASGKSVAQGGAIANNGLIGDITGDFIDNYAKSINGEAYGGAIYNTERLGAITGDFIGNYAESNSGDAKGGAVYSEGDITFKADGSSYVIKDNYIKIRNTKDNQAIYMGKGNLTFNAINGGSYTVDDKITGDLYKLIFTGDKSEGSLTKLKDEVSNAIGVNITDTNAEISKYHVSNIRIKASLDSAKDPVACGGIVNVRNSAVTLGVASLNLALFGNVTDMTIPLVKVYGDSNVTVTFAGEVLGNHTYEKGKNKYVYNLAQEGNNLKLTIDTEQSKVRKVFEVVAGDENDYNIKVLDKDGKATYKKIRILPANIAILPQTGFSNEEVTSDIKSGSIGAKLPNDKTHTVYYGYTKPTDYEEENITARMTDITSLKDRKVLFLGNGAATENNGGAISNSSDIDFNITADFINWSSTNKGGAIYNGSDVLMGTLTGDFIGNNAESTSGAASGGAIINYGQTGAITGDFIENYAKSTSSACGGAIYNDENASTGNITGDFVGNYAWGVNDTYGGAIYNNGNALIGEITGDFIGNYAKSTDGSVYGGAIYNKESDIAFYDYGSVSIGTITGDFIGNYAKSTNGEAYGGAIYNAITTLEDITGDFIGNFAESSKGVAMGGAIINSGQTGALTGDFIENYAKSTDGNVYGGAVYNNESSTMGAITGDFIGNLAESTSGVAYGGAIYNNESASIRDITGNFIGNYAKSTSGAAYGGAIYNNGINALVGDITGDFIGNYAEGATGSKGGAIYNSGVIDILTNGRDIVFSGNKANEGGAIYNAAYGAVKLCADEDRYITFVGKADDATVDSVHNTGQLIINNNGIDDIVYTGTIKFATITDNATPSGQMYIWGGTVNIAGDFTQKSVSLAENASLNFSGNTELAIGEIDEDVKGNIGIVKGGAVKGNFNFAEASEANTFTNAGTWYPVFNNHASDTAGVILSDGGVINMAYSSLARSTKGKFNPKYSEKTAYDAMAVSNFTINSGILRIQSNVNSNKADKLTTTALTLGSNAELKIQVMYDPAFAAASAVTGKTATVFTGNMALTDNLTIKAVATTVALGTFTPTFTLSDDALSILLTGFDFDASKSVTDPDLSDSAADTTNTLVKVTKDTELEKDWGTLKREVNHDIGDKENPRIYDVEGQEDEAGNVPTIDGNGHNGLAFGQTEEGQKDDVTLSNLTITNMPNAITNDGGNATVENVTFDKCEDPITNGEDGITNLKDVRFTNISGKADIINNDTVNLAGEIEFYKGVADETGNGMINTEDGTVITGQGKKETIINTGKLKGEGDLSTSNVTLHVDGTADIDGALLLDKVDFSTDTLDVQGELNSKGGIISTTGGATIHNDFNIDGATEIYGGFNIVPTKSTVSNFNFNLDGAEKKDGYTFIKSNVAIDLSKVRVTLTLTDQYNKLAGGKKITLIDNIINGSYKGKSVIDTRKGAVKYRYKIGTEVHPNIEVTDKLCNAILGTENEDDIYALVLGYLGQGTADQAKSFAQARLGGISAVNSAGDLVANVVMENARPTTSKKWETFASLGGHRSRYDEIDNSVELNMFNVAAGLSKVVFDNITLGVFAEGGDGRYYTENKFEDGDVLSKGDINYFGGGVFAKYAAKKTALGQLHSEVSFRAGHINSKYNSDSFDTSSYTSFDMSGSYLGAHAGFGYKWNVSQGNIDTYVKYLWNRQGSASTVLGEDAINLDATNSHRVRVGARYNNNADENGFNFFGGLAYEYEFDGKAKGSVGINAIPSSDLRGGSGMAEIGVKFQKCKCPWQGELAIQGYTGKRESIGANLSIWYMFGK